MDGYLFPGPPPPGLDSKRLCRDGPLPPEPSFTEDLGSPYSVNVNLLLPDVSYLHPGLCRPVARPIKAEPLSHSLVPPGSQDNNNNNNSRAGRIPCAGPEYHGLSCGLQNLWPCSEFVPRCRGFLCGCTRRCLSKLR
ncbi:unnamed protein product [Merluccius merluccius]